MQTLRNCHFTRNLLENRTQIVTLNANTKETVTLLTLYGQIGQKLP